jgi:hypothetical protein
VSHKKGIKVKTDNSNNLRRNLNDAQLRGYCNYKCYKCGVIKGTRRDIRIHIKESKHNISFNGSSTDKLSDCYEAV